MALLFLAACSDSTMIEPGPNTSTVAATIRVKPGAPALRAGATRQFTAYIAGVESAVNWSASGGIISAAGLYTAPVTEGSYTVTATSVADVGVQGTATVTVAPIVVTTSVDSATLKIGKAARFEAVVAGATDRSVTWSATGGAIAPSGLRVLYTAPMTPGSYELTATSVANPAKSATIFITVTPRATIIFTTTRCELSASATASAESPAGSDNGSDSDDLGEGGVSCVTQPTNSFIASAAASSGASGSGQGQANYTYGRTGRTVTLTGTVSGSGVANAPAADLEDPAFGSGGSGNGASAQTFSFSVSLASAVARISASLSFGCEAEAAASAFVTLRDGDGIIDQRGSSCEGGAGTWTYVLAPGDYTVSVSAFAQGGATAQTRISCDVEQTFYPCGDPGPISNAFTNTASYTASVELIR